MQRLRKSILGWSLETPHLVDTFCSFPLIPFFLDQVVQNIARLGEISKILDKTSMTKFLYIILLVIFWPFNTYLLIIFSFNTDV